MNTKNHICAFTGILSVCFFLLLGSCGPQEPKLGFNQDIRPILNAKCLGCHGGVKANGDFSLLFEEDAFATTQSGVPSIIRGNHKKSGLFKRLVHADPELENAIRR